jgi:hypothetical protein
LEASPGKKFMRPHVNQELSKKLARPPSQPIAECSGMCLSSQAMKEAEIMRITVPDPS